MTASRRARPSPYGAGVAGWTVHPWDHYLADFHDQRPGITEDVLALTSADDGRTPYDWLADALPADGLTVDVGCGSGPLAALTARWIGLDRSPAELARATRVAPGRLVLADAARLPMRPGTADAVVCSMTLMLLDDPRAAAAEMAGLLRDGGLLVALLPAAAPLTLRDRSRYVRLLAALRLRRLPFRHADVAADPRPLLAGAGLTVMSADRRRFAYPIAEPGDARRLLNSLYLPRLDPGRHRAARRVTRRWTGSRIGIPLLRVVATTHG